MPSNRRAVCGLAAATALLLAPAAAHADSSEVTRFPVTEALYNPCNDDMVIVNATLVVSTKLMSNGDKLLYETRTSYEDVSAESNTGAIEYRVTMKTRDEFRSSVRAGQEKVRSLQSSLMRFKPLSGKSKEWRVTARYAYETDTATGETRVREDSYQTQCK